MRVKTPPSRRSPKSSAAAAGEFDQRVESVLSRHERFLFPAIAALALALAWLNRFVQDDAFISFIYARSWIQGNGLTWFGTRVEGYTDFLWVAWIALGLRLGVEPVLWSQVGSLASFAVALYALWRLAITVSQGGRMLALLAMLLFASNYTVLSYATGGLETMLQTALLTLALLIAYRVHSAASGSVLSPALLSLTLACAVLTHPDSALPAAIILGWVSAGTLRRPGRGRTWLALMLPFGIMVGGWLVWKLAYYGDVLPNSFRAKVGVTPATLANGGMYLWRFFHWYALWPIIVLGLVAVGSRRRGFNPGLWPLVWIVLAWLGYVVWVGGDFMEFRFLVPIAPLLFVLVSYLICEPIGRGWLRQPVLAALLAVGVLVPASVIHARSFRGVTEDQALDSIETLGTFYGVYEDRDWGRIGKLLKSRLGAADPILALHAVGAIPYYSGLRTVDMLGLNDPWVAVHGIRLAPGYRRPGHRRRAPPSYLRRRGVNFIIGHPTLMPLDLLESANVVPFVRDWVPFAVGITTEPIPDLTLVLMPVNADLGLVMWYLTPSPALDSLIAAQRWPRQTFYAAQPPGTPGPGGVP